MFSAAILTHLLLTSAALAAPSLEARLKRRAAGRQSRPNRRINASAGNVSSLSNTEYSANWAGAALAEPNSTFSAVTGTVTVPTPSGVGSASAWVGIDGYTYKHAILQTGVDLTVQNDGSVFYDAWYEWYPDYTQDFSGISILAGHVINMTVIVHSTTSGTAIIENLTNGQTVSTNINSTTALRQQNAEWIVEDYTQNDALVSLADFGTVTFTDAYATVSSGIIGPTGATLIDIQHTTVITDVSYDSSSVTVTYL